MKPATDPSVDYKVLVRDGYNRCADEFSRARMGETVPILASLTERLGPSARVLDIGCGAGIPVARSLVEHGFAVTGVDLSETMVDLARANVPEANFLCSDVMAAEFGTSEFDAVVAFYSVFHIPREEQPALFRRVHRWLKPGGFLLVTVTNWNEAGYTEDFFGVTMYWSNFGLAEYKDLLRDIGFDLLESATLGHGYDDPEEHREERHPVLFVQKRHS